MVSEQELPDDVIRHADGHALEVAGYVVSKYIHAPNSDQQAFGAEAEYQGIESDILGMWRCQVCRSRFSINELDIVLGVPNPIPVCPTLGCSGAGWDRVHPD